MYRSCWNKWPTLHCKFTLTPRISNLDAASRLKPTHLMRAMGRMRSTEARKYAKQGEEKAKAGPKLGRCDPMAWFFCVGREPAEQACDGQYTVMEHIHTQPMTRCSHLPCCILMAMSLPSPTSCGRLRICMQGQTKHLCASAVPSQALPNHWALGTWVSLSLAHPLSCPQRRHRAPRAVGRREGLQFWKCTWPPPRHVSFRAKFSQVQLHCVSLGNSLGNRNKIIEHRSHP